MGEGVPSEIVKDLAYFSFTPQEKWHSFEGYGKKQYCLDPCKLQLITAGIDIETGEYTTFGIPATILATYLREQNIIPEKCDLNTILFLLTPAETKEKLELLVKALVKANASLEAALPSLYAKYAEHYKDHSLRDLCQEMHDFYKAHDTKEWQKRLFQKDYLPTSVMTPQEANIHFLRNRGELVPITAIEGRIALEGALPYPPGVICVQPGEIWSKTAQNYFLILEESVHRFPGFSMEIQGSILRKKKVNKLPMPMY